MTRAAPTCSSRRVTVLPMALLSLMPPSSLASRGFDSTQTQAGTRHVYSVLSQLQMLPPHANGLILKPHPSTPGPRACGVTQKKGWRSQPWAPKTCQVTKDSTQRHQLVLGSAPRLQIIQFLMGNINEGKDANRRQCLKMQAQHRWVATRKCKKNQKYNLYECSF